MAKGKAYRRSGNYFKHTLIAIFVIAVSFSIYSLLIEKDERRVLNRPDKEKAGKSEEPQFTRHGDLDFFKRNGKASLAKIDIEIAVTPEARARGMMYRKSNRENRGMLFIFPHPDLQSFWMLNTYIPLDIIFVNEYKEIVKIHRKAAPGSTEFLPSGKNALYAVEVNGGFTEKFNISEGDRIAFSYY
ncbi:MAG: DUF192 domain-containing protein [Deltaproteobacteria bacterium]|nr:DUF192 domain-containing protein [Deltaproteobacteria bacterium]